MHELELLETMWNGPRAERKTELISVLHLDAEDSVGKIKNDAWIFNVTHAFRDSLDIKYEERKKNKKSYHLWTQGPIISFKQGDFIHSHCGERALQISFSSPMGWDTNKKEMYQGKVTYTEFSIENKKYSEVQEKSCSQMQFLKTLISGDCD